MAFTRRPHIMPSGTTTISGTVETSPVTPGQQSMVDSAPVVIASDQTAIPMSATALPLPTGAAIAAKQPAIGTSGSPATDVLTVQGAPAWGCAIPVLLPKSSKADLSMTEQTDQLFAAQCATVHLLTQVVALLRGRSDPPRGEEADALIGEYLDSRTRLTNIVN